MVMTVSTLLSVTLDFILQDQFIALLPLHQLQVAILSALEMSLIIDRVPWQFCYLTMPMSFGRKTLISVLRVRKVASVVCHGKTFPRQVLALEKPTLSEWICLKELSSKLRNLGGQ